MKSSEKKCGQGGWTPDRLPSLKGKTYVVTGANSGIGLQTTKLLAERGGRVVMLCRNRAKVEVSIAALKAEVGTEAALVAIPMDLSNLADIRRASAEVANMVGPIDALIANAGIMMLPTRTETKDGFETHLGVNVFGHFALAALLAERVEAAAGRFVFLTSIVHRIGYKRIVFEDPHFNRISYDPVKAYAQSKLADLLLARALDRHLREGGRKAKSMACHPGYSATNLQSTGPGAIWTGVLAVTNVLMAQSPVRGAWPSVLAAADPDAEGGALYGPTGWGHMRGPVREHASAPWGEDGEAAEALFHLAEEATGIRWPL